MSDYLAMVAYFTRVVDSGDYYIVEFYDKKIIVRKGDVERDLMDMLKNMPCPYAYAFLRILSLRIRFDKNAVMKNMRCQA
jgi:hypothetical protein